MIKIGGYRQLQIIIKNVTDSVFDCIITQKQCQVLLPIHSQVPDHYVYDRCIADREIPNEEANPGDLGGNLWKSIKTT